MKENISARKKGSVRKKEKVLAEICDIQSYVKSVLEKSGLKEFVYRGHASEDWELKPSIGRIDGYSLKIEKEMFITESYIIKKEGKEQILRDLAKLGYDKTLVYPLLDSLCEDIRKMYKMK